MRCSVKDLMKVVKTRFPVLDFRAIFVLYNRENIKNVSDGNDMSQYLSD